MFYGLRLLSATRAFRVDCRVKLIGVDGRGERRRTAWRQLDSQPAMKTSWYRHPLFYSGKAVGPLVFGGWGHWRRRRGLVGGAASVIAAACLAQASATSLPAIPWWPGIQSRVVLADRLLIMPLRSAVSGEPLWIALRSDWLSVQMAAAAWDGKRHSSAMRMAAFSSPRCCFVMRVVGLAGSPSVTTIPTPPLSVPAVAEPSV